LKGLKSHIARQAANNLDIIGLQNYKKKSNPQNELKKFFHFHHFSINDNLTIRQIIIIVSNVNLSLLSICQ